jgi:hypothetical protein
MARMWIVGVTGLLVGLGAGILIERAESRTAPSASTARFIGSVNSARSTLAAPESVTVGLSAKNTGMARAQPICDIVIQGAIVGSATLPSLAPGQSAFTTAIATLPGNTGYGFIPSDPGYNPYTDAASMVSITCH